jgi:hypothetical protein
MNGHMNCKNSESKFDFVIKHYATLSNTSI